MGSLGDTLSRLRQLQALPLPFAPVAGRLARIWSFGSNPGHLRAWRYIPAHLKIGAPLVVVLHGCRQTAAGYDEGAGWSKLADEAGFALLFPEQLATNNLYRCFNWFMPDDVAPSGGELQSIYQMIAAIIRHHRLNPHRVFITGLSAGGAMTVAMIARYPELFSGAAIIAGVPFGVAQNPREAFERMGGRGLPDEATLAQILMHATPHAKVYPSLSIWQGGADDVVAASNADALEAQFRAALEVDATASSSDTLGPGTRRVWRDTRGHVRMESIRIPEMGHGTPIAVRDGCGTAAPFMLDAGLCSTRHIAHFWGIASLEPVAPETKAAKPRGMLARLRQWLEQTA